MSRIIIDPITRIEGHLALEVEVEGGKVKDAWGSGTLFRGFEIVLKGRDPRDAYHITQRICGVCPTSHSHTAALCLENAVGIHPPDTGRLVRNMVEGAQFLHSHILWFYHLTALDYVDVVAALKASPKEHYLKDVQAKLQRFVESGQLGPFANAYWGHPAYKLPPELNLLAVAHYLEALERQAQASHISAIFGGRMPMTMTTPAGGSVHIPTVDEMANLLPRLVEIQHWVDHVFIPDVLAIAPYYLDYAGVGKGPANFLAWGVFDDPSFDTKNRLLPSGIVLDGSLKAQEVDQTVITEDVTHGWYKDGQPQHPSVGTTEPEFTEWDVERKYTWAKAPRYGDRPMEVGALARMVVAYSKGHPTAKKLIDQTLGELGVAGKPEVLFSVVGRIAARALETKLIADAMVGWSNEILENIKAGKKDTFSWPLSDYGVPDQAQGVGLWEAPRGALGHWNQIEGGRLANYQVITPTCWNISPRDAKGVKGPIEQALIGTPVADPKRPLEILRVAHSFDPCLACTVHVIDPESNAVYKVRVS
ncbi:MAG TPA: nickel-dependent hydrogenase large subunit [Nitrospiria bacterium]|nr:nickel-dependent hydrogenase large subunit [Nitrospiria bacterium]